MSREIAAIREVDIQMADLYRDFLPKKIFDAHVHVYAEGTIPHFYGIADTFFREQVTPADYTSDLSAILPGVEQVRLNMMPMVDQAFGDPTSSGACGICLCNLS